MTPPETAATFARREINDNMSRKLVSDPALLSLANGTSLHG